MGPIMAMLMAMGWARTTSTRSPWDGTGRCRRKRSSAGRACHRLQLSSSLGTDGRTTTVITDPTFGRRWSPGAGNDIQGREDDPSAWSARARSAGPCTLYSARYHEQLHTYGSITLLDACSGAIKGAVVRAVERKGSEWMRRRWDGFCTACVERSWTTGRSRGRLRALT